MLSKFSLFSTICKGSLFGSYFTPFLDVHMKLVERCAIHIIISLFKAMKGQGQKVMYFLVNIENEI